MSVAQVETTTGVWRLLGWWSWGGSASRQLGFPWAWLFDLCVWIGGENRASEGPQLGALSGVLTVRRFVAFRREGVAYGVYAASMPWLEALTQPQARVEVALAIAAAPRVFPASCTKKFIWVCAFGMAACGASDNEVVGDALVVG